MRARIAILQLLAPALVSALVVQRDEWDARFDKWKNGKPKPLVDAFSKMKGKFYKHADDANELAIFDDYEKPNQYVKVILSPGDSYTAGIGSNGPGEHYGDSGSLGSSGCSRFKRAWPEQLRDLPRWKDQQGEGWRKNNFGACSGATIPEITAKQLELGENADKDMFKKIGMYPNAPQLAVFTAGGNDLNFANIVKYCIYGVYFGDCEGDIKSAENRLTDPTERQKLKEEYHTLYSTIIASGRLALSEGGPVKPANFQLFQGVYIPFFDDEDDVCNKKEWSMVPTFYEHWLTIDFRKRLNGLVSGLNGLIKEAVEEYSDYGVFLVDSYVDEFKDHRFCSPTGEGRQWDGLYHSKENQDNREITWFWSFRSRWETGYEEEAKDQAIDESSNKAPNITKAVLDHLNIDEEGAQKLRNGTPLNEIKPEIQNTADFEKAISNLEIKDDNGDVAINLGDGWLRVFHPKGTALQVMANAFFDQIVAQRNWSFDKSSNPSTPDSPAPIATSAPTPPQQEEPKKTKSVQVFFMHSHDKHASGKAKKDSYMWHIFQGESGKGVNPCETPVINAADDFTFYDFQGDDSNPGILPNGEFKVKVDGAECIYQGLGEERPDKDVGWLKCPKYTVNCLKDSAFSKIYRDTCTAKGGIPMYYHVVAYCDW